VNGQQPYIANARQPAGYRNPVSAQQPYIANARYPANAQSPSNAQSPFTYNARYPANAQSPSNGQTPFTYNARYPAIYTANARASVSSRSPGTYPYRSPVGYWESSTNSASNYQMGYVEGVGLYSAFGAPLGSYQTAFGSLQNFSTVTGNTGLPFYAVTAYQSSQSASTSFYIGSNSTLPIGPLSQILVQWTRGYYPSPFSIPFQYMQFSQGTWYIQGRNMIRENSPAGAYGALRIDITK